MKVRISEEHIRVRIDSRDSESLKNGERVRCHVSLGNDGQVSFKLESSHSHAGAPSLEFRDSCFLITVSSESMMELISGNLSQIARVKSEDDCAITIEVDIQ